jgi:hypothetical protein
MSSRLKFGGKTQNKSSDNITIDAKHNEMIHYFKNLHHSLPTLKEELKKKIQEYNIKDSNRKNDIDYILYKNNLKDSINELKVKINDITNNNELNNYYLEVGTLLHTYYENIENSKKNENQSEKFEENLINYNQVDNTEKEIDKLKSNHNILQFFDTTNIEENQINNEFDENDIEDSPELSDEIESIDEISNSIDPIDPIDLIEEETKIDNKNDNGYTSMKISDFVKEKMIFNKKNLLEEYLQKVDTNYISKIKYDMNICKCSSCNIEMTIYPSDGIQICENCGFQQNILIESDKPSFKDPPMEVCYFSYKRINHYNEFHIDDKIFVRIYILFKFLIN